VSFVPGQLITNALRLESLLGTGGMGSVWVAHHLFLDTRVAIKFVHTKERTESPKVAYRFRREAQLAAKIRSPHVVQIFDYGCMTDGTPYIVMEMLAGEDLEQRITTKGSLGFVELSAVVKQACKALLAAHANGIVHRDIKPANLFLCESGYETFVKVLDFGIAKQVTETSNLTMAGALLGTAPFMSPELLQSPKDADFQVDLWALAVSTYRATTGVLPFRSSTLLQLVVEINKGKFEAASAIRADLPHAVDAWFSRALNLDVSQRFHSATEMGEAFSDAVGVASVRMHGPPHWAYQSSREIVVQPTTTPPGGTIKLAVDEALDELTGRSGSFPQPIVNAVLSVELARASEGPDVVVRRWLDLGSAVVRYALSVALAHLVTQAPQSVEARWTTVSRGEAALNDEDWLQLARMLAADVGESSQQLGAALEFVHTNVAARAAELACVTDDSVELPEVVASVSSLVGAAAQLLQIPLNVVSSLDPGVYERRVGPPLRPGLWKKTREPMPPGCTVGGAYLVLDGDGSSSNWMRVDPLLPSNDGSLLLLDCPHRPGLPWRSLDPESGIRREHTALDSTMRGLLGRLGQAPYALTQVPPLVGRQAVMDCISDAYRGAIAGGIRIVVLTGGIGCGRTRMLDEALELSQTTHAFGAVMRASCSRDRANVLRPLRQAAAEGDALESVRHAIGAALAEQALATVASRDAAIEGVAETVLDVSRSAPLLLLLDDAHWGDDSTLQVLRMLTARASEHAHGHVCAVVAARNTMDPPDALRGLLAEVQAGSAFGAQCIELDPLDAADAARLVQAVAPTAPTLEQALVHGAGGVPLYLVQPLLTLNETGALQWRDNAWWPTTEGALEGALPSIGDLVQARLCSYFADGAANMRTAQHLLALATMSATRAEALRATVGNLGIDISTADHVLSTLGDASLLTLKGPRHEVVFEQSIVRDAVYNMLSSQPWFRQARGTLLDTIAQAPDARDRSAYLARGYDALTVPDAATYWYRVAVERSVALGNFADAVTFARRLGSLAKTSDDRVRAALLAANALLRGGDLAAARSFLGSAQAVHIDDARLGVDARIMQRRLGGEVGSRPDGDDASLISAADGLADIRASIDARLAVASTRRGKLGIDTVRQAAGLLGQLDASTLGDRAYRVHSMEVELLFESGGDPATLRAAVAHAYQAAHALGSVWAELDLDNDLAVLTSEEGRHDEAIQKLHHVAERARTLRFGTLHRTALINIAAFHSRASRPQDAIISARAAVAAGREAGSWRHLGNALSVEANVLLAIGKQEDALRALDEATEIMLSHSDPRVPITLLRRADAKAKLGRHDDAKCDAELALGVSFQTANVDQRIRARLWLALHAYDAGEAGALDALRQVVDDAASVADTLRPVTKRDFLERAQQRLTDSH
jgi:tRNA A-37 threonylcarbamoyl transferase component Bud32/tetratricopeptide (TPR) repeat protein